MSDISRRDAISYLAAAFASAATIDHWLAREVHAQVQTAAAGGAAPSALTPQQLRTVERLADLIIPVENGKPGALAAGVPAWIDALVKVNTDLQARYAGGLAWLDAAITASAGTNFVSATPAAQAALLDVIAFRENKTPENETGVDFFVLVRRMIVDGYYTSDIGIRDINPGGRPPLAAFVVPQEAIDYVISRSPFK
jgi:hypothetical protein